MLTVFDFQGVAKHTQCNHYHLELQKTLLDSCIDRFTEIRDLNCGLATLKYMVENLQMLLKAAPEATYDAVIVDSSDPIGRVYL